MHYKDAGVGNSTARKECLDQLEAIIPHQCGDHQFCVHERWCTYLKVKNKNPDWRDEQIRAAAYHESKRALRGQDLSLHSKGVAKLSALIKKRFNEKTIDRIAKGGCSNLSESFWNMNIKFSSGKRLNQDHTDHWEVTNKLSFCRVGDGNIEKTHGDVSQDLCLKITKPELKQQASARKTRNRIKNYQKTTEAKKRRTFSKLSLDHRMGKLDRKKAHRSGKVPLQESASTSLAKIETETTKKLRTCSNCKLPGHTASRCKLPRDKKRSQAVLLDYNITDMERLIQYGIKPQKRRKELHFVTAEEWM